MAIHGTVAGDSIQFGPVGSTGITYQGQVSGNSMSGTYQLARQRHHVHQPLDRHKVLLTGPGTVKVHLSHFFAKLGITTRAELTVIAGCRH
jgi:hypothetical protein